MLTRGTKLGHYEILAPIGVGGMGEVYRARDERLERDVAVKVLPAGTLADEAARKRFRKEALALSKLNHPNIATIFDFDTEEGVDYLVMEHISGEMLADKLKAGPLPESQVLRVGAQVAEGLEAGHREGIVHRDVKPGNLRLTPDGRVKILDFGLAKAVRPAGEVAAATESLTQTQAVVGTLPYMAPEQLRGEPADARTDIYALGCVLYEMATGQRPFPQTQAAELTGAILHQAPRPPRELHSRCSPGLERIILKALAKDPELRYQSAKELLVDLRRLAAPTAIPLVPSPVAPATGFPVSPRQVPGGSARWVLRLGVGLAALAAVAAVLVGLNVGGVREGLFAPATPKIDSLAVLPLENLSHDPEQDYFADGMTEALTAELSKISALKVISRTSAMQYKGVKKPMPEIARELGVDALIEGSVLHEGDQVRITVQLIHGPSDKHLWAESYQRELRGILALQSEVARAIAREIKVAVTPAEATRLSVARPVNPEAYRLYLLGRYQWNKRTREGFEKAAEHFQQAIDLDPAYALAYAGLADVHAASTSWGFAPPSEGYPRARAVAFKALELDRNLAGPYATLGLLKYIYDMDWRGAEEDFRRALELDPNYASGYLWYGILLTSLGRHEEAIAALELAEKLDPLAPNISRWRGQVLYYARRYDAALRQLQKTAEMHPDFYVAHVFLASTYLAMGRSAEALAAAERASAMLEVDPHYGIIAWIYGRAGRTAEARRMLRRLQELSARQYIDPGAIAIIYVGLGENKEALTWLERAYEEHGSVRTVLLKVDPAFDALRDDPRFQALLRRMNLPEN